MFESFSPAPFYWKVLKIGKNSAMYLMMLLTRSAAWCSWWFWGTKGVKGGGVKLEGGSSGRGPRGDGSGFGTAKIFKKD